MIAVREPVSATAEELLEEAAPAFFGKPPQGHFWLEHLVKTFASVRADKRQTLRPWRFFAVRKLDPFDSPGGEGSVAAVYAISSTTRYAMFHAVDPAAGGALLAWALDHHPPVKVLSSYIPMERALEHSGIKDRISRDHRELFLELPLGGLQVEPDWHYRLAREEDIPRLREYNAIYNQERRTRWSRDWARAIAHRNVYVRERDGVIASCLLRGALLPPRISFGGTFTFPEFRGLGDATMLVANFCAEMALSGLQVCLIVDDDNPAALRVYTKVGFMPAGLYRTTYFSPPDRAQ